MNDKLDTENLDTYIRNIENQQTKGILLKLKNEMRKSDITWDAVKTILVSLEQKDPDTAKEVLLLLIREP